ncbi:MAG: DUF2501 domain-containing protein [Pigmentiphaga sp.]|nr:DUF2501 domain-containing protein [Pigmentiphaga sp.]
MKASLQRWFTGSLLTVALAAPAWSAGFMDSLTSQATEALGGSQAQSAGSAAGTEALGGLGGAGALGGLGGLGGLGLPAIGSGTASNAAGVLQYCVQNRYLGAAGAQGVKDQLLGKLGMSSPAAQQKDTGFQQGLAGVLQGGDGATFNLAGLQDQLKEKACDYVLDNVTSFL